ncbi:MAG TPA: hypothetical protein VE996_01630 [Terriglobales bacterium]|nr:hypothetical protein [Terriglobales bacterium]
MIAIPPPPDLGRSLIELAISAIALIFFTLRYAHSRVAGAKLSLLAELKQAGLLSGDPHKDYRTLTRLIHTMSPAVTLRSEFWVGFYAVSMNMAGVLFSDWAHRQLQLLAAHQAGRYKLALQRLDALRFEA